METNEATAESPEQSSQTRKPQTPNYLAGQRPQAFSRSAAKRDSVMALGSIAHLQHRFAKQGLASREK